MKRDARAITIERALGVVERAPNFDRDHLVKHVQAELQRAYDDGVRAGELAARERSLREQIAIEAGRTIDSNARMQTLKGELQQLLANQGKVTT